MNIQASSIEDIDQPADVEVSVPLPPDLIAALRVAVFQRRSLGDESADLVNLVQKAVSEWLEREIDDTTRISIRA
jgi:hypothetical protein